MKECTSLILAFMLIFGTMSFYSAEAAETENIYKAFYVSTSGSDNGDGLSRGSAFRTLERAQEEVRKYNRSMTGDIVVNVLEGTYFLDNPLDITEEDSGFNGHNVIWRGEGRPTISGGRRISGFKPSEKYRGIYELKVDNIERIWNMYVNGEKRYYAKSEYMVRGVEKPAALNTDEYYKAHPGAAEDKYSYYDENTPFGRDGMYISKEDISQYENAEDVICYWNLNWESHILPVESIENNPYDNSNYIVRMKNGLFDIAVARNEVDRRYPRPEKYFQIGNAMELLDSPGELYYNRKTKMLYYMPTEKENLDTAEIIIPELERIMFVGGSDRHNPAKNITFEGFNIAHTAWYNLANGIVAEQGTNNFGFGLGIPNWSPGSVIVIFPMVILFLAVMSGLSMFITKKLTDNLNKFIDYISINEDLTELRNLDIDENDDMYPVHKRIVSLIEQVNTLHTEINSIEKEKNIIENRYIYAQINPHLLYNALSVLKWKCMDFNTDLANAIDMMSDYFRKSINFGSDEITFAEEIELVRRYVSLMNFIKDKKYTLEIDFDDELLSRKTIRHIFQPLVENSILHGIRHRDNGNILIKGTVKNNITEIIIKDNGVGIPADKLKQINLFSYGSKYNSFGIKNTMLRLKLFYNSQSGITIDSAPGEGTTVTIKIYQ
ncbi:MAG: hypothetical protein E7389_00165 [Ruminococcaceae bacterium]|nr:hypothetical protein [Oscillospiraceae bacterium]